MRNSILSLICIHLIGCLSAATTFAWTGEASFTAQSRENIRRIASEMIELSWTPHINFQYNSKYPFKKGTVYHGEAYTQHVPMENWSEFYSCMDDKSDNNYYQGCDQNHYDLGNDCSGFVSMSWKMPERYDTTAFNCDAVNSASSCYNYTAGSDDYATKLGDFGSAQNIILLPGDALVRPRGYNGKDGHIVIFDEYEYDERGNKIGIKTLEQVCDTWVDACWAKRVLKDKRRWSYLADYRPIRRNKIDEGNYTFVTKWGAPGTSMDCLIVLQVLQQTHQVMYMSLMSLMIACRSLMAMVVS